MKTFRSVDEYFSALPEENRLALQILRKAIHEAAPRAEETIGYNIPAFKWNGMLVWYAAFKKHIGFYPKASAIAAFRKELASYKTSKGTIQFPIEKRIPVALVKKIVRFRIKENSAATQYHRHGRGEHGVGAFGTGLSSAGSRTASRCIRTRLGCEKYQGVQMALWASRTV